MYYLWEFCIKHNVTELALNKGSYKYLLLFYIYNKTVLVLSLFFITVNKHFFASMKLKLFIYFVNL